jgi:hypothetical protein
VTISGFILNKKEKVKTRPLSPLTLAKDRPRSDGNGESLEKSDF